jgi:ureidoglycolate lyase
LAGSRDIVAHPLTREAFAPFGDVIDKGGEEPRPMNGGKARRFHALASAVARGESAQVVLSIAEGAPYLFPLELTMVERHPLGSQAFVPLSSAPFLVAVCSDEGGRPGVPLAFVTQPGQGVNYFPNTWHAVLTPIEEVQDFLIVDRAGAGHNLEEFTFEEPWTIHLPGMSV